MPQTMKAAVFAGEGNLRVLEVEKPRITRPDQVLIRVEYCAICGSDVSVVSVPRRHPATCGTIIGHEYMGVIEETGSAVTDFSVGERVAIEPNITCGKCDMCKTGHSNMCRNIRLTGFHAPGGMAEYSLMPERQLHKLRDQSMDGRAVALAEPLACIVNSLRKFRFQTGDYCVVLGAGPIGLMYAELLLASGAGKVIVSAHSELRKRAALALGAVAADPREEDLFGLVDRHTGGAGADIVIDCVGNLMGDAVRCCAPGGQVVLFGLNSGARETIVPFDVSHRELSVFGSYVVKDSFPRAIRLIEERVMKFPGLVTHVYGLEDIHKGFAAIRQGEAIKVVIKM